MVHSGDIRLASEVALRALPADCRVPAKELFEVLDRHQANLYGIMQPGGDVRALGSFLGVLHLFNHSCMPNTCLSSVPIACPAASGGERGAAAARDMPAQMLCAPLFQFVTIRDVPVVRRYRLASYCVQCLCTRLCS